MGQGMGRRMGRNGRERMRNSGKEGIREALGKRGKKRKRKWMVKGNRGGEGFEERDTRNWENEAEREDAEEKKGLGRER